MIVGCELAPSGVKSTLAKNNLQDFVKKINLSIIPTVYFILLHYYY